MRTQLALHIRFTEYTGIYNVRTGFAGQHGELIAKMRGSPQHLDLAGFYFLNVPLILNAPLNLFLLTKYYLSTGPNFHLVMEEAQV